MSGGVLNFEGVRETVVVVRDLLKAVPTILKRVGLSLRINHPGVRGVHAPISGRRREHLLPLLGLVLIIAGCSGFDANPPPSNSTTSGVPAPASLGSPVPAPSTPPTQEEAPIPDVPSSLVIHADGHAITSFATPTGGIVCDVGSDPGLRCQIPQSTWSLPPRPPGCHEGWGGSVDFGVKGGALSCSTDSIITDASPGAPGTWWQAAAADLVVKADVITRDSKGVPVAALPYGASVVVEGTAGTLTCTIARTGVTCVMGSHRMMVSRTAYSFS